jgi:hypothetical protein
MFLPLILRVLLTGAYLAGAPTWAAFPAVTRAVQQERDGQRREILTAELTAEQAALAEAGAALAAEPTDANRADLHRHTQNIKALQRELAPLRRGTAPSLRVLSREARAPIAAAAPIQQPAAFWDPYRRITTPLPPTAGGSDATVLSTTAKESP